MIIIEDSMRGNEVPMMERVNKRMPRQQMYLNQLMDILNEETPRRNLFYSSLYRIAKMISKKTVEFKDELLKNFQGANRRSIRRLKFICLRQMQIEMEFYNTSECYCECGGTMHYSMMYRVQIPCSHLYCQ
jgi:hypothetical protein